jgi:FtsH-binding integral membrane protein
MKEFKAAFKVAGIHGKILLKGFLRTMYGALTAGLFALAICGYAMIITESGWVAVSEFVLSTCTAILAVICMYVQGGHAKKGAKR